MRVILLIKFEYKKPRLHTGDFRTPITFYEFAGNEGPEPGETEKRILYKAWAKVDEVWQKDLEEAKSNGTLDDVTITIRDPLAEFIPNNRHYFSIDAPEFMDKRYNITKVLSDLQDRRFIKIVGELSS